MLDRDSENNKIYFDRQNLAPYLDTVPSEPDKPSGSEASNRNREDKDEADAAAGGASVLQRVTSFGILPRSSSTIGLTGGGGGVAVVNNESNKINRRGAALTPPSVTFASDGKVIDQQESLERCDPKKGVDGIVPSWRLRDRMKTVGVGIIMASCCSLIETQIALHRMPSSTNAMSSPYYFSSPSTLARHRLILSVLILVHNYNVGSIPQYVFPS